MPRRDAYGPFPYIRGFETELGAGLSLFKVLHISIIKMPGTMGRMDNSET